MAIAYEGIATLCFFDYRNHSSALPPHTVVFIRLRCQFPTGAGIVSFVGHLNRRADFTQLKISTSSGSSLEGQVVDYIEHNSGGWIRFEVSGRP